MLENAAPGEASPRVRALLVLACGVHAPDAPSLHAFLVDRDPAVREAAVLAAGHRPDGAATARCLTEVRVPVGRPLPPAVADRLRARLEAETDPGVRAALETALASSPR
jgi:hypothetical protein